MHNYRDFGKKINEYNYDTNDLYITTFVFKLCILQFCVFLFCFLHVEYSGSSRQRKYGEHLHNALF